MKVEVVGFGIRVSAGSSYETDLLNLMAQNGCAIRVDNRRNGGVIIPDGVIIVPMGGWMSQEELYRLRDAGNGRLWDDVVADDGSVEIVPREVGNSVGALGSSFIVKAYMPGALSDEIHEV